MAVDQYPRLDLRHVVGVLRQRATLILGVTLAVAVAVFVLSASSPKQYETFADAATLNPDLGTVTPTEARENVTNRRLATEAYYVTSPAVEARVTDALGADFDEITGLTVEPIELTDVLRITVSSYSPEIAKAGADAYAQAYVDQRRATLQRSSQRQIAALDEAIAANDERLLEIANEVAENPVGDVQSLSIEQATLQAQQTQNRTQRFQFEYESDLRGESVSVSRQADLPTAPFEPNPFADAIVAGLIVLVLTVGTSFLLDQLDNRIKNAEDIARIADGLPVIGTIPLTNRQRWVPRRFQAHERELVSSTSVAAEAYRVLATSLRFSSLGKEKRTILITSTLGGEGKTTVTANLAAMLAESGLRVVLVSADLRRPQLGALLGVNDTGQGLTSAMLGDSDLSTCFVPVALPSGKNLYVLPSGPLPHEPAVLLGSDAFGEMLDEIKEAGADFILIDCAPVLPVSDPLAASRHVDGVLLLTLADRTKQAGFRSAVERLRKVDADIIGVVLNGTGGKGTPYGYQYYGDEPYAVQEPAPPRPPASDPTSTEGPARGAPDSVRS